MLEFNQNSKSLQEHVDGWDTCVVQRGSSMVYVYAQLLSTCKDSSTSCDGKRRRLHRWDKSGSQTAKVCSLSPNTEQWTKNAWWSTYRLWRNSFGSIASTSTDTSRVRREIFLAGQTYTKLSDCPTKAMSPDRLVSTLSIGLFDMTPAEESIAIKARIALKKEQEQFPDTSTYAWAYPPCTGSVHTLTCCTHMFLLHSLSAHIRTSSCASHTRMAQVSVKRCLHMCRFSPSRLLLLMSHPSLLFPHGLFETDPVHTFLPYFPVLKAQDMRQSAHASRSLAS